MNSSAALSPDGRYRFHLQRMLSPLLDADRVCGFLMLNPSTADSESDDPTIRRCIDFALRWDCTVLQVVNLSPLRATDPEYLIRTGEEPQDVWETNLRYIRQAARDSSIFVAAYGNHGGALGRDRRVLAVLRSMGVDVYALGLTKAGHPKHPLYVAAETQPRLWMRRSMIYDLSAPAPAEESQPQLEHQPNPDPGAEDAGESDHG